MKTITLIPGDGIGPEIIDSVKKIIDSMNIDIEFDEVEAGEKTFEKTGSLVPENVYNSIEKNKVALKGPITTPVGKGFKSINVSLRQKYDLYTNLRPVKSIVEATGKFFNIDLVIFRENTEGLYVGLEHMIRPDIAEAIKIISRDGSYRIIKEAFEYAVKFKRKKVTLVHKANIMKLTDGLFLNTGRELSMKYPNIEFEDVIVDNMCMQLVINPNQFDVIVAPNLYGDILSDLCAGLVGGLGLVPGANIGDDIAIFEAVHGSAPDIAGKNIANPTAVILSACMMLDYLGYNNESAKLQAAIKSAIEEGFCTKDIGGNLSTTEFTKKIISLI